MTFNPDEAQLRSWENERNRLRTEIEILRDGQDALIAQNTRLRQALLDEGVRAVIVDAIARG